MDTIFITNDCWRALVAEQAGVDRVMVDLEIIGKFERQRHLNTLISQHSLSDVNCLRSVLERTLLMVRINPIHEDTRQEVDDCVLAGANMLMIPMISRPSEVMRLVELVDRRCKICLLIETGGGLARLRDIISIPGIDEVHIGLNDLHMALKLDFMFEAMSGGLIDFMAEIIRSKGLRFGIGGVARMGKNLLSPELIISEHVRLGSSQVLLSRDFNHIFDECSKELSVEMFRREIEMLHRCEDEARRLGPEFQAANSQKLKRAVDEIVEMKSSPQAASQGNTPLIVRK
jgi:2-keto-3-deoxy-L-rhamnonate aldolase RhmA